jgi:hypothetical protein
MPNKLGCSKVFNPALFIGEGWSAAEQDERANELTEIDMSTIALVTCLTRSMHERDGFCTRRGGRDGAIRPAGSV